MAIKLRLETEEILSAWCAHHLPEIVPLDKYNPSFEELVKQRMDDKCFVFAHGSSNTIFNRVQSKLNYRAWHDTMHLRHCIDFSEEGEAAVAVAQETYARDVMGICERDARLLRLDIELHIKHYYIHRTHPEYQTDMIVDYLLCGDDALEKNYGI
jgi:hypothetical protein